MAGKVKDAPAARGRQTAKPELAPRARRYDPAETRQRVLEAAYYLFGTRGYSSTSTADIAAEANVSEGSIFYHFGSKHALLVELGKLHGLRMVNAMQGDDRLEALTFKVTLNRCFDFCEANNVWEDVVIQDGECPTTHADLKKNPAAEPFFLASKEVVMAWTKAHMDAVAAIHGSTSMDTDVAASLIFATVGQAMHRYFAPDCTEADRQRIRRECIRFCTAAAGHPALETARA